MKTAIRHINTKHVSQRGLGTVEAMLFVFFGILAFGWGFNHLRESSQEALSDIRMRQIAEDMVRIARNAEVAGVDLVNDVSVSETVSNLEKGKTVNYGVFAGQHYGIEPLDPEVKERVVEFLYITKGKLQLAENQ